MGFEWLYSSDLQTVVRNKIIKGLVDTIGDSSPTMALLMNDGNTAVSGKSTPAAKSGFFEGGKKIERVVRIARIDARGSHRDYQPVKIQPTRTKTAVLQDFGRYYGSVDISMGEAIEARGPEAKLNLMSTKYEEVWADVKELIAEGIFNYDAMMLSTSDHFSGMNGLGQLCGRRAGGTNYGGINREWMGLESDATHTFWNSYRDSVSHPAADLLDRTDTTDYIVYILQNLVDGCTIGGGKYRPTNLITNKSIFNTYKEVLRGKQEIQQAKVGSLGFEYLYYEGIPIIWDSYCPDYHIYALNMKPAFRGKPPLGIIGRKGYWFQETGWKEGQDTLERVKQVTVDLNMWCDNPRLVGAALRVGDS